MARASTPGPRRAAQLRTRSSGPVPAASRISISRRRRLRTLGAAGAGRARRPAGSTCSFGAPALRLGIRAPRRRCSRTATRVDLGLQEGAGLTSRATRTLPWASPSSLASFVLALPCAGLELAPQGRRADLLAACGTAAAGRGPGPLPAAGPGDQRGVARLLELVEPARRRRRSPASPAARAAARQVRAPRSATGSGRRRGTGKTAILSSSSRCRLVRASSSSAAHSGQEARWRSATAGSTPAGTSP